MFYSIVQALPNQQCCKKNKKYIESINNHGCGCGVVYFSIDFQGNTAGNVAIYQSYIKFGLFLILR